MISAQITRGLPVSKVTPFSTETALFLPVLIAIIFAVILFGERLESGETQETSGGSQKIASAQNRDSCRVYTPNADMSKGKKIVLISGDEEYRSEEEMNQLGKILSQRHGFETVVLFPIDPETGYITPTVLDNIPGLEHLRNADLVILGLRFRNLPNDQMKEIDDYLRSGRPLIATRTTTHAFKLDATSPFAHYTWNYKGPRSNWQGGFGRKILGETWVSHHGRHGVEGTRAIPIPREKNHPILKGVDNVVLKTDVYTVHLRPEDKCRALLEGEVLSGFSPSDPPVSGEKNKTKMPVAWIKSYSLDGSRTGTAFVTTMGSGQDLLNEGFRRLLINACYELLNVKGSSSQMDVRIVEPYDPWHYGFGKFKPSLKPTCM